MLTTIHSDAWLQAGATIMAVGFAAVIGLIAWSVKSLISKIDKGNAEQTNINNAILRSVDELKGDMGLQAQRISYLEGIANLPLGKTVNKQRTMPDAGLS